MRLDTDQAEHIYIHSTLSHAAVHTPSGYHIFTENFVHTLVYMLQLQSQQTSDHDI